MLADPIKILFADSDNEVRETVIALVKENKKLVLVGVAKNEIELFSFIDMDLPDIVVLGLDLPHYKSEKILCLLNEKHPRIRIIVFSFCYEKLQIYRMINKSAEEFLVNCGLIDEILNTISSTHNSGFFAKEPSRSVVFPYIGLGNLSPVKLEAALSFKEKLVLKYFCDGKSYRNISQLLFVSIDTVKFHMKKIYSKTSTNSVSALLKYAIKNGITGLE